MGFLLHIALALGVLALAESGLLPSNSLAEFPVGMLALCALPHLLAYALRRLALRGRFQLAGLLLRLLAHVAPLLHAAAILLFGWQPLVRAWLHSDATVLGWPGPELLVELLPYLLFELLAIDAQARLGDPRPEERARARRFQARMLLSGCVPIALYALISGALGRSAAVRVALEEISLWSVLFSAGLLALFALCLPWILCNTWETAALERGWQRLLLEQVAQRAHFRCKSLLVWRTGGQIANAAIVGFWPAQRVVLFTDLLLQQLQPRELAAVFAHEIGHARRQHVCLFAAFALGYFLCGDRLLALLSAQLPGAASAAGGLELVLFALLVLGWYFAFGYLSRRAELDADLYALEQIGDPEALVRALEQVGGMHTRRDTTWRHFSTADRVLFLRAAARDPGCGQRLRRTFTQVGRLSAALLLLGLGLHTWRLLERYPVERTVADLRLGEYPAAIARSSTFADSREPDRQRLHTLGERLLHAPLPADQLDGPLLLRLAQDEFQRGDLSAAEDWLELAALRSTPALEAPLDELYEALEAASR